MEEGEVMDRDINELKTYMVTDMLDSRRRPIKIKANYWTQEDGVIRFHEADGRRMHSFPARKVGISEISKEDET